MNRRNTRRPWISTWSQQHALLLLGTAMMLSTMRTSLGQQPAAQRWTPETMMQVKRIGAVQVSPDGKRVALAVREAIVEGETSEYRTQIHLVQSDGLGQRQLTGGDKSCDDPQWSPDGNWIAFISNRIGKTSDSDAKNLWLIPADGGEAQQLTDMKGDVGGHKWSPDGKSIAFTALDAKTDEEETRKKPKNDAIVVDENIKHSRLYVVPVTSPTTWQSPTQALTPSTRSVAGEASRSGRTGFDWSPDGKMIVFSHVKTPQPDDWASADLSLVNVASGMITPLASTDAAEGTPLYSPDGNRIAFSVSDIPATWAGTRRVGIIAATGGSAQLLAETQDGFGRYSEIVGWTADGKRLLFTEMQGTNLRLLALPLAGEPVLISRDSGMSAGGVFLNPRRTHVGFAWERLSEPPEAYCTALESFAPVKVSNVQPALPLDKLTKTEVVSWKSTDGFEVDGLLTYPTDYQTGTRCPMLLVIHGGPMGVFTQSFDGAAGTYPVAAFAARGYAVLRPNPRGSSGYGQKFRYANYGDWGGGDFRDLMAGVDQLIAKGIADSERLGVMGWSYGGFMTSWTITQTKRFRAASVGAGVTNLVSFTGTADIPSFLPDYFGGEFWDRLDVYRAHSAMFHVRGATTPTLIQHGERDLRVPLPQGMELYNALKRQGCATKMVIYPRTPHGIEEPRLLLDCMQRNIDWFAKYIPVPER